MTEGGSFLVEVHIVVKGDTLWKIARQHGIPFDDLKRVNAHLANPDYIVPGMKIFLPKKQHKTEQHGTKGEKKENVKQPERVKQPEKGKAPVTPPPKAEVKPSKPPIPLPPTPAPPPIPMTLPPVQVQPPLPAPMPAPMPAPPPTQSIPMPPFVQPIIGIPCGWMPIYDADCYPFMHSGQIQAMPRPQAPMQQAPQPMPCPSTQFPIQEQQPESPIFSGQGPAMIQEENQLIEGWKLVESPEFMYTESPGITLQPSMECPPEQAVLPDFTFDESPDFDLQPCPPPQGYIPQQISPAMQEEWNPAQFGYPVMPHPGHHPGCGCGCGCSGQQQDCGCGCSGQHPHPHFQHQPMMVPLFYGQPCNCHGHMQQAPHPGMPAPYPGSNWYGAY
nr:LysM peptidoglycan-binding domain-containing protein [Sporosarcina sp. JAI121]